jgi:hypothetical protein
MLIYLVYIYYLLVFGGGPATRSDVVVEIKYKLSDQCHLGLARRSCYLVYLP